MITFTEQEFSMIILGYTAFCMIIGYACRWMMENDFTKKSSKSRLHW